LSQSNLLKVESTVDLSGENVSELIHVPINDRFYAIVSGGEFYFYPYETSSNEQTFHKTEPSYTFLVDENPNDCMIGNGHLEPVPEFIGSLYELYMPNLT